MMVPFYVCLLNVYLLNTPMRYPVPVTLIKNMKFTNVNSLSISECGLTGERREGGGGMQRLLEERFGTDAVNLSTEIIKKEIGIIL